MTYPTRHDEECRMNIKDGGPAFPGEKNIRFGQPNDCNEGMTLRDYFAAASISSVISVCSIDTKKDGESIAELFARKAFEIADAMLAAREVK